MPKTRTRTIGTAVLRRKGGDGVQVCTGTYRGDLPSGGLPFNLMTVRHDRPFPFHAHEYAELVVVLGGESAHRTDVEDYPIATGDVFVLTPPRRHGFPDPKGLELCNVQFDPARMFAGQNELRSLMGFHALFDLEPRWRQSPRFRARLRLDARRLRRVRRHLDGLDAEQRGAGEGRDAAIRARFLLLVTDLCRFYAEARAQAPTPVARLADAVAYARRNLGRPIRLSTLARVSRLSSSQFHRVLRRAYGTTPVRWLNGLRIEAAQERLRTTDREIAAIARETGFRSASFFSTQFKRFTGLTPRAYRRTAGGRGA